MKFIKTLLLTACLTASLGSYSTAALARCEDGSTCIEADAAINHVVNKILEARHAIDNGADSQGILNLIQEAINLSLDINANDTVNKQTQKAAKYLKLARKDLKQSALQKTEAHLVMAEKSFNQLYKLL